MNTAHRVSPEDVMPQIAFFGLPIHGLGAFDEGGATLVLTSEVGPAIVTLDMSGLAQFVWVCVR